MAEYIDKGALYEEIAQLEELARNRYLDTPSNSPDYQRYMAQMQERTSLKHLIADFPDTDVAPVLPGKWEWFEEWSQGTTEYPTECDDCGWRCSNCKTALEDVVGGYWDDPYDEPKLKFCPNCGAKMDLDDAEKYDMEMSL